MRKPIFLLILVMCSPAGPLGGGSALAQHSFGLDRDEAPLQQSYRPPCVFPPLPSPCAVGCKEAVPQAQAVPCAIKTACPSKRLPCHGVSYYWNPYDLFRVR
ncbi:MAG: hypothetical protein AB1646_14630 [Thermodesulfobacteriota bacterium]